MNQRKTEGIILQRTDYGEADRIITVLTADAGKLHVMAKGVRRVRSKLAGGIELFSVSELSYVQGKGTLGTLVSARLMHHFEHIVQDIDRTMLGYELIRMLHKTTEDEVGGEYFSLLRSCFGLLDSLSVPPMFVEAWFSAQLLKLAGHMPNLVTDAEGVRLTAEGVYTFDFEAVCFRSAIEGQAGVASADEIKYLRLLFSDVAVGQVAHVANAEQYLTPAATLIRLLRQTYLSV